MAEDRDSERDVMTSLPRTRPARRSAKRDTPAKDPAAPPPKSAAKPAAAARAKAAPRPKAPATSRLRPKAAPAPTADGRAEPVPPAGYSVPRRGEGSDHLGAGELITTAIQAAGELAQIGFTIGRQALRTALDRLPRP